jgi:MFS family permease
MWIAITASNIGTWMNEVGVTWMMANLVPSNLMIALIQTATTLPFLFLSYPAGALADIYNRRKILLSLHVWMLISATALTLLTFHELTTEWWLLILTFALATGNAMMRPAFSACIPAFVPPDQLHKAVTLNSLSTNASKAIGPAVGGLIIAVSGPYVVFAINAISFVIITLILFLRFPKTVGIPSLLPPEGFIQALRGGLNYTLHDRELRTVLIRCIVFFVFASAFWSLMPALLIRNFHASAQTYGTLMALTGVGSVIGAVIMPWLYRRWSRNQLFGLTSGLYGCGLLLLADAQTLWAVGLIATLLGLAWMTSFSALMIACQLTVPDWVRARALAILMLSYGISATPGSALWGYLADSQLGITGSLTIAGAGALTTLLLGKWLPLSRQDRDHTPSEHWQAPPNNDIDHVEGPVTVTRKYQIDKSQRLVFQQLMNRISAVRRRNGAVSWQLQEKQQGNYTETIVIANWLDYLRHRERLTIDDRQLEDEIIQLSKEKQPPRTEYTVANHRWSHPNH